MSSPARCATSSPPRCGRRSTPPSSTCAAAGWAPRSRRDPYSVYAYVRERAALFWGLTSRTMLRDEASAFLAAGGRIESGDMVLRMLRVALPPAADDDGPERGQALALLQAVGGFQAYRRAVPAPPNAVPVARFLLFERAYPDSVAAAVESALNAARARRPQPAQLRAGPAPAAPERRPRVPRPRAGRGRGPARHAPGRPGGARAGRHRHRRALLRRRPRAWWSPHELRHPLPHRVPLRRTR